MTFDTYFRASSHAMIACGALTLAVSGGMSAGLAVLFALVLVAAWKLEGTKWRLSERVGLITVLLSLPLFYVDWTLQSNSGEGLSAGQGGVNALVHLTLFLSSIKLLQVKADRDWLFLYLISFFEVLLAAGLSISPLFLVTLSLYLFCALLTIICFELRKARRAVAESETRLLVAHDATLTNQLARHWSRKRNSELRRLPQAAFCLLLLVLALALPIFFITPRYGDNVLARAGGGSTGFVGFSDEVTLGDIARLERGKGTVMRVRVDEPGGVISSANLRWRGVALDRFDGRRWRRSSERKEVVPVNSKGVYPLGTTPAIERITKQTFFIEPIDTPVLFVAPRAIGLQGTLPFLQRDTEDALTSRLHPQERITYRAFSDTVEPRADELRADAEPYTLAASKYLQLPRRLDARIASLASLVGKESGALNRYDTARAIEAHLNGNAYGGGYSYRLESLPSGADPLADFLFDKRAGHCEFFSTAMTVMLRTQGIASRVVNGFQTGRYNRAADVYTVEQQDAHSWVEVYFPETDAWVTFDPTPPAGRSTPEAATGFSAQLQNYVEALELFWIQYVVAYDKDEQRSIANNLRSRLGAYRRALGQSADGLRAKLSAWWQQTSSNNAGAVGSFLNRVPTILLFVATVALLILLTPFVRRFVSRRGKRRQRESGADAVVAFYERMLKSLAARGIQRESHQTPLEFATATGVPEALSITHAYHRVRYGAENLSATERAEIEQILRGMEDVSKS